MGLRIGHGYDVHAYDDNRPLVLAGVVLRDTRGLLGHSDADVVVHAIIDALLGAARLGDIGTLFPDTDSCYANINSCQLLAHTARYVRDHDFEIIDIDITLVAQEPRIAPYRETMRKNIATTLGLSADHVGIKATTAEHLGFVGRREGMEAWAVCLLENDVRHVRKCKTT